MTFRPRIVIEGLYRDTISVAVEGLFSHRLEADVQLVATGEAGS